MAALCEAAGQVFYWGDPEGGSMILRGDLKGLLGFPKSGFKGGRAAWLRRVHPADLPHVTEALCGVAKARAQMLEYRFLRPGGSAVWLRETIRHVRDPESGVRFLAGTLADVSEARSLAAQLRQSQKMRAFGELAGGVAHDFNNLLTLFHGYTELLQMTAADQDEGTRGYLNELAAAVERARELSSQLHRFGCRKPAGGPGPTELGAMLKDFRQMIRRLLREKIELFLSPGTGACWVMADPPQIESLLINLAVNACEAMPGGGRLRVGVEPVTIRPRDRRVVSQDWQPGAYIRLTVADTGEGIRRADGKRIFEPGFTTRGGRGAEGAGLAVCREIVADHGGQIVFRSVLGKGSTFEVYLPAIAAPAGKEPAAAPGPLPRGNGEKILIVEDDAPVRKALAAMVTGLGYRVLCASNGTAGWVFLQKDRKIRLVIADLVMPLMDGGELAELVYRRRPDVRLILTSGYACQQPQTKYHTQYSLFLPKPIQPRLLAHHLRNLLDD